MPFRESMMFGAKKSLWCCDTFFLANVISLTLKYINGALYANVQSAMRPSLDDEDFTNSKNINSLAKICDYDESSDFAAEASTSKDNTKPHHIAEAELKDLFIICICQNIKQNSYVHVFKIQIIRQTF